MPKILSFVDCIYGKRIYLATKLRSLAGLLLPAARTRQPENPPRSRENPRAEKRFVLAGHADLPSQTNCVVQRLINNLVTLSYGNFAAFIDRVS